MDATEKWRARVRNALEAYFRRRSFPRITLSLVLIITGAFGFLISYGMLRLGVEHMWGRYPIAVLASYVFLLVLIRLWIEVERARFDPADADIAKASEENWDGSTLTHAPRHSWWDYFDLPSVDWLDWDEGCLPGILFLVVVALAAVLVFTLAAAPLLIAEVFLDAFLVTVLYRRLRIAQTEHWLGTALRKTGGAALITALALALGGWVLEELAPGARSIGKAIEQLRSGEK